MTESTGVEPPPSTLDSVDSLICAVAAAPAREPPRARPFDKGSPSAGGFVGRYRLVRELGRGGMGTVWEAAHRVSGKHVALKIARDGLFLTPQLRHRFAREAQLVTAVGHPGVVDVHDLFEDEQGRPVLVMDLLAGQTLGSWLKRSHPSPREIAEVLADVTAIVAAAHGAGVVHRDLKPDNIFVCNGPSDGPRVRVLDFGIARWLDPLERDHDALTDTGTLIGTPPYMAPEQLFGEHDVDAGADIWALGAILFECIAGHRPVRGDNIGQVVRHLSERGVASLDPGACPSAIRRCVRAMLDSDRKRRLRDLGLLERTLRAWGRGEHRKPPFVLALPRSLRSWGFVAAVLAVGGLTRSAALIGSKRTAGVTAGVTAAGALGGPAELSAPLAGRGSVPRVLNVATLTPKGSAAGRVLEAFRRSVSLRTAGELTVNLRFSNATGFQSSERALVTRLRTEQLDGAVLGAKSLPLVYPGAAALGLPGIVDSWIKVDWVREHLRDPMREGFTHEGYRLLAFQDEGCQRIMTRGHAVRRPTDLGRHRVAVADTDALAPLWFALAPGALSVPLGESDISDALRSGTRLGVSAVVGTAGDAERFQWSKSLTQVTMMPVACTAGALVLRENAYARLDPESRAVVDDLSYRLDNESSPRARQEDTAASLRLRRALDSVDPSRSDRREWQRLFHGAAQHYARGVLPAPLVAQVLDLSEEIDALE